MRAAALLLFTASLVYGEVWTYWVQPCGTERSRVSACRADDPELAGWALQAWQKASDGKLTLRPEAVESKARIRIYWASADLSLYGEARPIQVEGKRGAAIYVLPDTSSLGDKISAAAKDDRLFRASIVYLTCLHESGHALGLPHTRGFEDIMYSFGFGGDIVEYFARYRRQLQKRSDIPGVSGISPYDREVLARITGQP